MQILIASNFVYALVLPILYFFISMYIMRNTSNVMLVMIFQMANYTALVFIFFLNGYLLRIIPVKYLYSLGMLISGISMSVMIMLKELDTYGIAIAGSLMGTSFGLFWSNRNYLALSSTNDNNRNYYYGIEHFLEILCSLTVPIIVGWFIAGSQLYGWFGGSRNYAYYLITIAVLVLAFLASIIVCRGNFVNPEPTNFLYLNYHPLWYKVLFMEILRGLGQGFMMTIPAILIMKLMGGAEGVLGIVQSIGAVLTAIIFYGIARISGPEHRLIILLMGLLIFVAGACCNAFLFSSIGVMVFIATQLISTPLTECSFAPVILLVIDVLSKRENRNQFAYLLTNEVALYIGRLCGGLFFIIAAIYLSENFALRYVIMSIGFFQLYSYFLCKKILIKCKSIDKNLAKEELRVVPYSLPNVEQFELS